MLPRAKIRRLLGEHHLNSLMLILFLAAAMGMLTVLIARGEAGSKNAAGLNR